MKIIEINDNHILFDNGDEIGFDHDQDCCECNYADFEQLDDLGRNHVFNEPIVFEAVPEKGFRFGNPDAMFFVLCYSEQNGYYSLDVDIYYKGNRVLNLICDDSRVY